MNRIVFSICIIIIGLASFSIPFLVSNILLKDNIIIDVHYHVQYITFIVSMNICLLYFAILAIVLFIKNEKWMKPNPP